MSVDQYSFNPQFQEKVLALLVRDVNFMASYREVIKPFYFENPVHVDLARLITQYYDKFNGVASVETCINLVDEYLEQKLARSKEPEKVRALYYKTVDSIYGMDFTDTEYVRERTITFAKEQALKDAILKGVDLLGEGKYDQISDLIFKAQMVGENASDLGLFYFEEVGKRIADIATVQTEGVLGTGSKDLDEAIGGLAPGELGFILAPPNVGKTIRLINLGVGALWQRKTVVHYTLEMSEGRVAARYDSCLTGKTYDDNMASPNKLEMQLEKIRKMSGGNLIIKSYPTQTATVNDIKSHLTMLKNYKGIEPGLIIVDYADLLRSTQQYNDKRHEISSINTSLRALSIERVCPLWTASQTNRAALDKKIITIGDLAEDFSKAAIADVIVALCQTQEEYDAGLMREFIAKSRNSKKFQVLSKQVDYARMAVMDNGHADAV